MSAGMIWYKTQPDSAIASCADKALSDLLGRITSHDITVHPQKIAPLIKNVFSRSDNVIIVCGSEAVRTENNIVSILSHALGIPMETNSRSRSRFCCDTIRGIRLQSLAGSVLFPSRLGGFEGILLTSGVQNIIVLPAAAKSVESMVVSIHKFLLPQIRAIQATQIQAEKNALANRDYAKFHRGSASKSTTRSYDEYELQCKMENAVSEMRRREGIIPDSIADDYNRSDYEDYRLTSEDTAYYKKRTLGRKIRNAVSLVIVAAVACSVIAVGSYFDMSTFASSITSETHSSQTKTQNDAEKSFEHSEATSVTTKSETTAKTTSADLAAVSKTTTRVTASVTSAKTTAKNTSSTTKKTTVPKTTPKTTAKKTTAKKTTVKKTTAKKTEATSKKTSSTTNETTVSTSSATTSSSVTDNAAVTQTTTATDTTTVQKTETTKKTTTTTKKTSSNLTMRIKSKGKVVSGNAVDILASIVEAEMGSSYNLEALKAQAVAAYTFYLYSGGSSKAPSFPTKTPGARAKSAARAVLGKKMTYNGKIPYTPYYAISAGKTAANATINGTALPYLKAVDCSPDKSASGYKTVKSYSSSQVAKKVKANTGIDLTSVSKNNWFKITERDANGLYVVKVNVGGKSYRGSKLWLSILGSSYLRSACFYISYNSQSDTFTFTSYGYGHGVGMSQKGANAYASQGKNYQWILKHFYSGVTIT
ncbi:MAG: SpoIID/LytB domain-containing protein [Firmicutes bacterium]|nr:SpoIID/LytB domain-containing protein [Bacillota bacterium]